MPLGHRKGALNGQRRVGQSHDVAREKFRNQTDPVVSDRMANQITDNNGSPREPGPDPEQSNDFLLGKMMQQLRRQNEIKRSSAKRRRIAVAADNRNPATPKMSLVLTLDSRLRGNDSGGESLQKGDEKGTCLFLG